MDELIKTFHIDWKLLIAQIVNFGIVLFVLWRFALKPLMKVMDKRSQDIVKSLDEAKQIEENLARSEKDRETKIMTAKKDAAKIIEEAREQAGKQGQKIIEEAKGEVQTIVSAAKEQMVQEKKNMILEVKAEVSSLVIATTKKVLSEVVDENIDKQIIEKTLNNLKS